MKTELITMEEFKRRTEYWVFTTYQECPICGKSDTFKERRFTPKPEDSFERYQFEIHYDYCDVL